MNIEIVIYVGYAGLLATGFLLVLAALMKKTHGLFWSRTPQEFIEDANNPKFDIEKSVGNKFIKVVFKYVPPFFIGFLLILLIALFFFS
ncbi:hypothetical protein [Enterococcus sp. HY326]|uniref:hypothetical protein n=1 Tax=Enterococcus sp. HY326 TaxID=2971265 RepID=UPI00223F69DD|nr:hypothetical protein [Enterococcus sp. HY326]